MPFSFLSHRKRGQKISRRKTLLLQKTRIAANKKTTAVLKITANQKFAVILIKTRTTLLTAQPTRIIKFPVGLSPFRFQNSFSIRTKQNGYLFFGYPSLKPSRHKIPASASKFKFHNEIFSLGVLSHTSQQNYLNQRFHCFPQFINIWHVYGNCV